MVDVVTPTIRLTEPTPNGDTGVWPGLLNSNFAYIDEAINQTIAVTVPDANVVLVADGTSGDQARYLRYNFTGALTADRTITVPSNVKVGLASNNTTGGHNILLTTGGGSSVTLNNSGWTYFQCDGTNVTVPPLGIGGSATNDNAVAGTVGEYISSSVAPGAAVGLTSTAAVNVTSINLSAGDWDVEGSLGILPAGGAVVSLYQGTISTVSATFPTQPGTGGWFQANYATGIEQQNPTGMQRVSLASNTTVYLVAAVQFASGTVGGFGFLRARRMR